ncbi:hypothetical protein [Moraxella lacunata]|uniref:hypothetical protein n=1 Tax=Moraxella lacunata TaxID=477 RepID=UPI003EE01F13
MASVASELLGLLSQAVKDDRAIAMIINGYFMAYSLGIGLFMGLRASCPLCLF